jgi:hypothetical protein
MRRFWTTRAIDQEKHPSRCDKQHSTSAFQADISEGVRILGRIHRLLIKMSDQPKNLREKLAEEPDGGQANERQA